MNLSLLETLAPLLLSLLKLLERIGFQKELDLSK